MPNTFTAADVHAAIEKLSESEGRAGFAAIARYIEDEKPVDIKGRPIPVTYLLCDDGTFKDSQELGFSFMEVEKMIQYGQSKMIGDTIAQHGGLFAYLSSDEQIQEHSLGGYFKRAERQDEVEEYINSFSRRYSDRSKIVKVLKEIVDLAGSKKLDMVEANGQTVFFSDACDRASNYCKKMMLNDHELMPDMPAQRREGRINFMCDFLSSALKENTCSFFIEAAPEERPYVEDAPKPAAPKDHQERELTPEEQKIADAIKRRLGLPVESTGSEHEGIIGDGKNTDLQISK